ncbi:schwannomin-interacting protein 1 [Etheostoma spectabile]|uniref:schwannomin-interacting protein 1 n=1 Tax=Etheostoma spectabile TaxID=54343 RepID=UPI0013AF238B|nr:schwannomin-interacting protein 1-like [Etheostoma spectabile]XP_032400378.1 schwannomin-interacting protein 1-like [Etheostoma spectabile]
MEGEKEQQREEKESNEAEDDRRSDEEADNDEEEDEDSEGAALIWQEGYGEDSLGLPIMHWEALSLRIAELEKQEEENKEKRAKSGVSLERGRAPVSWAEDRGRRAESWEDGDDACNSHVLALTSRLQTQMNLQLCFINDSESEEEEDEKQGETSQKESSTTRRGSVQVHKNPPPAAKPEKPKSRGFRNTLRNLRDRLRTDHKTLAAARSDPVVQRRHVERSDLQNFSIKDLKALCTSLSQTIQDLSSDLVGRLQVRDQLRTEQDAMLLEVQDLTSL